MGILTRAVLVGSLAWPSLLVAGSPRELLEEAARSNAQGRRAEAVKLWEQVWVDHPGTPYAADALFLASEAQEESGDYDSAQNGYARLVGEYPSHRLSPKAGQRIEFLKSNRASGDAPLRTYREILRRFYQSTPDQSIARMEKLAEAYPDFPLRGSALIWVAERNLEMGRFRAAVRAYDQYLLEVPRGDRALDALEGKGMALARLHRYAEAGETWGAMEVNDPASRQRVQALLERVKAHRFRRNLFLIGILPFQTLCLLSVMVFTPWRTVRGRHLRSGLKTVAFVTPLLGAIYWVLLRRNAATAQGVFWILASVPPILLLNSIFIATGRIHAAFRRVYPVLAALFVAGTIYGIFYALDLVFVFEQTWKGDVEWQ